MKININWSLVYKASSNIPYSAAVVKARRKNCPWQIILRTTHLKGWVWVEILIKCKYEWKLLNPRNEELTEIIYVNRNAEKILNIYLGGWLYEHFIDGL